MPYSEKILPVEVGPLVDPRLDDSTPLYRIIDFFSAANFITSRKLYIPLAKKFQDPNEGVDASISLQSMVSGPCGRFFLESNPSSNLDFLEIQKEEQRSNYVSCWTRERESIAMWSLYSQDRSSVQIETTSHCLRSSLSRLAERSHDPKAFDFEENEEKLLVTRIHLKPVMYITLESLIKRIKRRGRAYDRLESLGRIRSDWQFEDSSTERELKRANDYRYSSFSLKDSSYSHEQEVRAIITAVCFNQEIFNRAIKAGSEKVDSFSAETLAECTEESIRDCQLVGICGAIKQLSKETGLNLPESINLEVDQEFVKSVTIDPRCPPHKKVFMTDFFSKQGIPIRESRCFGYAAKNASIRPRQIIGMPRS